MSMTELEERHIKELSAVKTNVERIEQHIRAMKLDNESVNDALSDIKKAIVGSAIIGNKGLIATVEGIRKDVEDLKDKELQRQQSESNIKWIGGAIITILFALMVWIIQHLPPPQQ